MKRIWWIVASAALIFVVGAVGVVALASWGLEDMLPDAPFSSSYRLASGEKVTVSGIYSGDLQGDTSTSYKITLQFPGGKREVVTEGTVINNAQSPSGPFVLARTATHLFLSGQSETYIGSLRKGRWAIWNYKEEPLYFLGRALMPSRYAHRNKFLDNCPAQSNDDCLPEIPFYNFERWNASSPLVVMRWDARNAAEKRRFFPWPRRLVLRAGKLDISRTLSLEPRLRLRPLAKGVRVELLKMSLPNADSSWANANDEASYRKAQKVRGVRVLGREAWELSTRFHTSPSSAWSAKGRTTFQLRGVCSDPDPKMLFFGWKVGADAERWGIAHNGRWRHILEPDNGLRGPQLFVRFSWPKRQTDTGFQK